MSVRMKYDLYILSKQKCNEIWNFTFEGKDVFI